ncbi:barstar family protein [Kitasatospora arboriphila]
MHEDGNHRLLTRHTAAGPEHGPAWGVCAEVDGLFGEPRRATYELFGWAPQAEVRGWIGSRVWLVPEDETLDPWLVEDAECPGRPAADSLVLTGLDDHLGPPEGHRGRVRVHDGQRWLGSCREFTRVLPADRPAPPLVLRGLLPGDLLRAAPMKGTRKALDLEQAALEIRDDHGDPFTDLPLRTRIIAWYPSAYGADLVDLELDGTDFTPVPVHARPVLERWLAGPPDAPGAWAGLDTRRREVWLDVVRDRSCRRVRPDLPAYRTYELDGRTYELDGRHVTDEAGLHLALGEAVNGPGGYFGGCLDALVDCLRGTFGHTAPATLVWREAATAREHLSRRLAWDGRPRDLFAQVLDVLARGGVRVVLA